MTKIRNSYEFDFLVNLLFNNGDNLDFKNLDYQNLVKISSKHLLLPALFLKLKQKKKLNIIPHKLKNYLCYIFEKNQSRNKVLIDEVTQLSNILYQNKINHVFLKGTANIFSNIYKDIGERMIGDIDFIYDKKYEENLIDLLINEGYEFYGENIFFGRHLERTCSKNKLFAIEPHFNLFNKKNKLISVERVLSKKVKKNEVFVPSLQHLLEFNILNHQINDHGSKKLKFSMRNIYDSHSIIKKAGHELKINSVSKHFDNYFYVTKETGVDLKLNYKPKKNHLRHFRYSLKKKIRFYNYFDVKFINISMFISSLPSKIALIITNRKYLSYQLKRLVRD